MRAGTPGRVVSIAPVRLVLNVSALRPVRSAVARRATSVRPLAAAVLGVLLVSCTPAAEPAPEPPGANPVLESRELLGEPMVELAEAAISLSEKLDSARHEVVRGDAMRSALREVETSIGATRDAAAAAADAAEDAPVAAAAAIVKEAATQAGAAADAARREVRFLKRAQAVDARLLDAAAQWDRPGSQSEIRARLAAVADDVAAVRRRARRLKPVPALCSQMKRNRIQWSSTVRQRTQRLEEQANSAGGSTFDELRDAFRRLPLGVEPRTADQDGRKCWERRSAVATAAGDLRAAVGALEASLSDAGDD